MNLLEDRDVLAGACSGGMQRRVCMGMCAVQGANGPPALLVLDEFSAGLDPQNKRMLWGALARILPGRGCVLVTHDFEEADALASHLLVLQRGTAAAQGEVSALLSAPTAEEGVQKYVVALDEAAGGGNDTVLRAWSGVAAAAGTAVVSGASEGRALRLYGSTQLRAALLNLEGEEQRAVLQGCTP